MHCAIVTPINGPRVLIPDAHGEECGAGDAPRVGNAYDRRNVVMVKTPAQTTYTVEVPASNTINTGQEWPRAIAPSITGQTMQCTSQDHDLNCKTAEGNPVRLRWGPQDCLNSGRSGCPVEVELTVAMRPRS